MSANAPSAARILVLAACAACLALAAAWPAHAAVRDIHFVRAGSELGLAQSTVTALAQDANGFAWVGTQGGLSRYDGQRFVSFHEIADDPASLPDNFVTALAVDADKGLWVGTRSEYVSRLDLDSGRFHRYPRAGTNSPRVEALLPVADATWIGTSAGLDRLDPRGSRVTRVLSLPGRGVDSGFQGLARDRHGDVWYANRAGLFRIGADGRATRVGPVQPMLALRIDRAGRTWVGGDGGLYLLRNGDSLQQVWPQAMEGNGATRVQSIAEAPDGSLWLSIVGAGLRRFDPQTGAARALRQDERDPAGLPEDMVNALMVDRSGLLWVGTQFSGLAIADSRGAPFPFIDLRWTTGAARGPVASGSVRSIAQDDAGFLWVGTDDGRLLRIDGSGTPEDMSGLLESVAGDALSRRITGIARTPDGRLWLGSMAGLFVLDPRQPSAHAVDVAGYPRLALRSLLPARDGGLWLGSDHDGLIHFDIYGGAPRQFQLHGAHPAGAATQPAVHALLEARDGTLWIGTGHGLEALDPRTDRHRAFHDTPGQPGSLGDDLVRALAEDGKGRLWVGTNAGLVLASPRPGGDVQFAPVPLALSPASPSAVYSLVADARGMLWVGTNQGLLRLDADRDSSTAYGRADGLQDLEFNGGAALRLADGRLAFGGIRGLNVFDPQRATRGLVQPPRLLEIGIGERAGADMSVAWNPGTIELPQSAGLLRLRVGGLDYIDAGRVRYRHRIEGVDAQWIDNGNNPDITYTLLPAGNHVLEVQASNRDGSWYTQTLQVPIHVQAPWWRHPLALFAYALFAAIALLLAWLRWKRQRLREQRFYRELHEREERLKLALWASGEQFWDYDLESKRLLRLQPDDHSDPETPLEIRVDQEHSVHPDDLPQVLDRLREHLRGDAPLFQSEHRVRTAHGWTWVRARGRTVERDADGRVLHIAGTARNITRSRQVDRERQIAAEVLRSMNEAVSVLDRDFRFISINPAFTRMTGYSEAEVIGRGAELLNTSQHEPEFYLAMRRHLAEHGGWSGEMWQMRKDGEEFLCLVEANAIRDASGRPQFFIGVISDITHRKRAEQELRYLANFDTLTNLPNRTLLAERLSRAIVRARRQDGRIAVLFLDLDRFKDVNDSLGHAAGDRILRAAALRLQRTIGEQHTVARLGGDEFTVVLENLAGPDDADRAAREIIMAFEAPLQIDDLQEISISPSIGISLYPDHAQVPTDLLKHADTAMYQAKAAGRRTFVRYDEQMDEAVRRRATIASALRKVLDREELRVVYQPRMSVHDSRIVGVEALLRWTSAEHGEIPPTTFIPLAEESGMILEIGEWVLREACLTLQRWRQHGGLEGISMAVNVSALQLSRGDLPAVVERVLAESRLPAERLELELTESVIMAGTDYTSRRLEAFRKLGVSLAVDDFGTGYSSLAYLKRLPITTLKIDKEFVRDITHDPDDAAITTTVIAMAHAMELNVVAEGVETEAQLRFLHEHGCDEIQGYWLSPPLEAQRCLAFLRNWSPATASGRAQAAP
ncbi:EAL domain-containing protein [Pseudoluteimonas lycopersici]|uniref:EAL domain-containing protein n=1 Tax=Pseudoluteimonas lycopersici TaxID=1324796 RepID=A0A516V578_9GAMM|nr:EAL domain-containing protein [Lysobacter lycopersici]QDQ73668.1 EAL domain-containing protein [Lysobacter lycopersici]